MFKKKRIASLVTGCFLLVSSSVFANEYIDTTNSSETVSEGISHSSSENISNSISSNSSETISEGVSTSTTNINSTPKTISEATGQTEPKTINFTGLVLDATGFNIDRTFSPTVKDDTGRVIYGLNIPNDVMSKGMMDYISPNSTTATTRAGNNPMVIKVLGMYRNNTSFVISKQDADILLFVDNVNNFLSKTAVVAKY